MHGTPILTHIITHTRTPITTIPTHTTLVVIILTTAIMITIIMVVAGEEDTMVAGTEEDPVVVGRAGDVEDLDRKRDPFGGEFESRVSTKQGSIAGSEMTLFCWTSNGEGNDNACGRMVRGRIPGYTYKQIGYALYMT